MPSSSHDGARNNGADKSSGANDRAIGRKNKIKHASESSGASVYHGGIDELRNYVYDTGHTSREQFTRTTKEIGAYISRHHMGAGDFMVGLNPAALGFPQLVYPPHPGNEADPFDMC